MADAKLPSTIRQRPGWPILVSAVVVAISYPLLERLPRPGLIPCSSARAEQLALSLSLALLVQLFLVARIVPRHFRLTLAAHGALILLVLWLGVFPVSPLGYSTGRIPNLSGFVILRPQHSSVIDNRAIVSLKAGSAVGIEPRLLDGASRCTWMSATGAALDVPTSCYTVYIPPDADYDILQVHVRSSCGMPVSSGQIRVSILP